MEYTNDGRTFALGAQFLEAIGDVHSRYTSEFGPLLYGLVLATQPKLIVETGTCQGYMTCWLGMGAKEIGSKVISVDQYREKPPHAYPGSMPLIQANLDKCGVSDHVRLVEADALAFLIDTPLRELGLVILDDYHECNHLLREIELSHEKLVPGGLILIHDTTHTAMPGIDRAARDGASKFGMQRIRLFQGLGYDILQKG